MKYATISGGERRLVGYLSQASPRRRRTKTGGRPTLETTTTIDSDRPIMMTNLSLVDKHVFDLDNFVNDINVFVDNNIVYDSIVSSNDTIVFDINVLDDDTYVK